MLHFYDSPNSNYSYAPWQIRHEREMRERRAAELEYRRQQAYARRRAYEAAMMEERRRNEYLRVEAMRQREYDKALAFQARPDRSRNCDDDLDCSRLQERLPFRNDGPWSQEKPSPSYSIVRMPDGRRYKMKTTSDNAEFKQRKIGPLPVDVEGKVSCSTKDLKTPKGRRKVPVIVEDASDSENEYDNLKSVWRNRLPSPGQWIEPVSTE